MNAHSRLQQRLAKLEKLVSGAVDCVLEGGNNVRRREWKFATTNLRKLFWNATAIARERRATFAALRRARKEQQS